MIRDRRIVMYRSSAQSDAGISANVRVGPSQSSASN
jgi:hypothetical protein